MSILIRPPEPPLVAGDWAPEITALLDEHHLAAWSESAAHRVQFAAGLAQFLGSLREAEVCVLYGRFITDLDSFCHQLERAIPGRPLERKVEGMSGVAGLLRRRAEHLGRTASKYRFYIWNDADELLRRDHALFARLFDAMAGVAAEAEYASDDLLMIHRAVLVGSSVLDVYAEDPRGAMKRWVGDVDPSEPTEDAGGGANWRIVSGLARPPVMRYSIDALAAQGEAASGVVA